MYTDALTIQPSTETIFRTVKSNNFGTVTQSAIAATFGSQVFTLQSLCSDYSSLQSVFDQYKILKIEVIFMANANAIAAATSMGELYTVLDYDDATALTSISAAQAYSNCIMSRPGQSNRRCFQPRVAVSAYAVSGFTQYKNEVAGWIDTASSTLQHYGLKYALDSGTTNYLSSYLVQTRAEILFRASR
jgi:hypothetical protein